VDPATLVGDGEDEVALGHGARDEIEERERDRRAREVDAGEAVLLGEDVRELPLVDPGREQARAERLTAGAPLDPRSTTVSS
jgi:hypothetical protein